MPAPSINTMNNQPNHGESQLISRPKVKGKRTVGNSSLQASPKPPRRAARMSNGPLSLKNIVFS